jgi:hypothetical protein
VETGASARSGRAKLRYILLLLLSTWSFAQQQPKDASKDQLQVRVHYLNVCTPPKEDQEEIRGALSRVPRAEFSTDFEISRGQTSVPDAPLASYVRVRHEYVPSVPFIAAQYSLSLDSKSIVEDLVFRSREAKGIIQIQLEDTITGAENARSVLETDTPVDRIKLERFGKQSVGLSRCEGVDQSSYQPLFDLASQVMSRYRAALHTKRVIPRELGELGVLPARKRPAPRSVTPKK